MRLAKGTAAEEILTGFQERSEEIVRPGAVEERYARYAEEQLNSYLALFFGRMRRWLPVRVLNRLCGRRLYTKYYDRSTRLAVRNYMECEAHREVIVEGVKLRIQSMIEEP